MFNLIDLTGVCGVVMHDTDPEVEEEIPRPELDVDVDLMDTSTFVPVLAPKLSEQETIKESVKERQSKSRTEQVVPWPKNGEAPINEFTTEGYISCAFPTLFPSGEGDFVAPRHHTVTAGNYFKHLMMYGDGNFARHPRFRYFALNTEMRWRALQTGRIYLNKHPRDARLTLGDLRDMVGREGECFANRVLHFASSLRGTSQYWFKQRNRLISMIDTLGMPTLFFTQSAADGQWPELARLICPSGKEHCSSSRNRAVSENPAIADWFFYHRIDKFVEAFYVDTLGAVDYWYRFEWQHRGSPHVHGVVWLGDAPDIEKLLSTKDDVELLDAVDEVTTYVDGLVSTMNPAISIDGSNSDNAPLPKTKPHVCNKSYAEVKDIHMDLIDLLSTCQRHTRCSTAYCLKKNKKGELVCRFHYPKDLEPVTRIITKDGEPTLLTQRNDPLLNNYNPIQMSSWRGNGDMQVVASRTRLIKYCAKYAAKPEPHSKALKSTYGKIMKNLKDDGNSLKMVQKLMISSVGERDFSAQETCHLLLQIPLYRASRDFFVLSLDGSRELQHRLEEGNELTMDTILDHYCARPNTTLFNSMNLYNFSQSYRTPKRVGDDLIHRKKKVVVIVRPICSPDPSGPKYEQYCRQKLMLHQPFRQIEDLLGATCDTYPDAYSLFLRSGSVPSSLADDVLRLEAAERENHGDNTSEVSFMTFQYPVSLYCYIACVY